ncbi:MAG TPA: K(+)-transporting ATPase subunit F [Thermoplasmata archaeon]|jgi:K+-transporting ATPase KdpF subunit|nr:K(+)-transporting ATPase subunit F [Thermoplasmata archaeon]
MGFLELVAQHLGLVVLTVLGVLLTIYLVYSMLHPERF